MHIGVIDLLVIYATPVVAAVAGMILFLAGLYIIVKADIGHLAVSEDIRYNIQLKKQPVTFVNVAMVMLLDSGVQAAFLYRCSRFLYRHRLRPLATVLHKLGKYLTNVDLPPTAKVGPGVVFLHCCNIVIGPYIEIGSHVVFRPCVALRGWGTVKLEDGVRTGLQSVVMDCVTMGEGSESAPGAVVTKDVPARHIALGMPAKVMVPRPETKLEGVVVELENVLLEDTALWILALSSALRAGGRQLPSRKLNALWQLPPAKVIARYIPDDTERQRAAFEEYFRLVRASDYAGLRFRPRGRELLQVIRRRGLKVAVISRLPDAFVEKEIVDALRLRGVSDCVCGADTCLDEWKPEPWIIYRPMRTLKLGVERVIYIGGNRLDVRTGIEAAVRVFWFMPYDQGKMPSRGLVTRFEDLDSIIEEFSKPELPQTI
jgi:serine O-acetyltransferase